MEDFFNTVDKFESDNQDLTRIACIEQNVNDLNKKINGAFATLSYHKKIIDDYKKMEGLDKLALNKLIEEVDTLKEYKLNLYIILIIIGTFKLFFLCLGI